MGDPRERADWQQTRIDGWRDKTAQWVSGLTLFLTVTGLSIFLLPFSVFNQHAVITHTVIGVLFLLPFAPYLLRHLKTYWAYPLTQTKFTGWVAGAMLVVCVVSGVVLTWQGAFGTRIGQAWRLTHIVTTFGVLLFMLPHLVAVVLRERRRREVPEAATLVVSARQHGRHGVAYAVVGLLLTGALSFVVRPVTLVNELPEDYDLDPYGGGPFAPSLAKTMHGGALDSRTLSGSATCGTAGCHQEIYEEWLPSAHRYASMDPGFQTIQGVMADQNGPVSTRYCGGCHDPISLFSGTKNIAVENLTELSGFQEGISCLSCHAIEETDVKGNANYVMSQPERYVYELRDDAVSRVLSDFLIRTYPKKHVETLSRRMFKTPEFCAACHKQFIDKEVNKVGWVQLQNQYDNWKASRWHTEGKPEKTIECRECHMPLQDSTDPASGDDADFNRTDDDGKHRSHRFLGANQFVPKILDLPGADLHCELTEKWLRGEFEIPEIADRWREGPAVPIELDVPREVKAGKTIAMRVHAVNNKVGHDFPTGPLDIIQAWIEVEVTDAEGREIFRSGEVEEGNFIETGTFMFKAEPVDRYGNLIDRHNLWEMVGVRFKRSMFPGAAEIAEYEFACPGVDGAEGKDLPHEEQVTLAVPADAEGLLTVRAKLHYRKFDQYLLNYAFGEGANLTAPATLMSTAEATIKVVP